MGISRRGFLTTVAAEGAVGPLSTVNWTAGVIQGTSPVGDVVGKITVGYQGWFACIGDGAPINGWWHWSNNWSQPPSTSNNNIKAWPDMSEYAKGYQTAYANRP